ncbi:MAG: hypothetical protein HYZ00_09925 [Candidatus Hydrogenedentes bacterium]|nr:hypothetical protein [Candidatus Hydrogenedentota bacterium]
MTNPTMLPYLLQLLDDDSEVVRDALMEEFSAFGPMLHTELARLPDPPSPGQRNAIQGLLARHNRKWLREAWKQWYEIEEDKEKLERALSMIAEFQNGPGYGRTLSDLLDDLAQEFVQRDDLKKDAVTLARFLFMEKGIKGERTDYYHPNNSNLVFVIQARRGLPISLACVYILLGHRLGLDIEGCNWPGHFFARIYVNGSLMLVDCFNEGHCIDVESFLKMQGPSRDAAQAVLAAEADAEIIISRVLNNLSRAYQRVEHWANSELVTELIKDLEKHQAAEKRG